MVQRKTCQATDSYNLQPETRFGQEQHLKNLGPEMMMMKRTKPRRKLKDNSTVSQSGNKPQSPPRKLDLVVKVTGGSPNYMKGTSSSEARIENKKRFNLSRNQKDLKHDLRHGVKKPSSRIVRGLTKAPSFKRCSQRATCSSTLKDSKFPEYLILNHGGDDDEVSGTSVLKVCPYTYCSLNGHLHTQYPPLKGFISSRRQSLKSQKGLKKEAYKEDSVELYVEENKEYENGDEGTFEVDIETQISETFSEGAPLSYTDSEEYSESAEMVRFSEGDLEDTLVDDSLKEIQETSEVDDHSDSAEMVMISEGDHGTELRKSDLEEALEDVTVKEIQEACEVDDYSDSAEMVRISEGDHGTDLEEVLEDGSVTEIQEVCEVDDYTDSAEMVRSLEGDHGTELRESDLEETLADESVKEIQEIGCFDSEVIGMLKNSEPDDVGEETLKDKAGDCNEESQDGTEVISMIEETAKVPFNRKQKPCNQEEESDGTITWTIIKGKKPEEETDDLRGFNPREPNYLPVAVDEDAETVDLKHQDMDERKNSEDWMFDYALQRAVTKLSVARKRKVALLVEAFETVQPIMPHGREPAQVLSCGRNLQTCN